MSTLHNERMQRFCSAGLYLVTSGALSSGRGTVSIVREVLAAGVRLIQLREKDLSARDMLALARTVRAMTTEAEALLIINDRLDVALAAGADGVHLGQEDLPVDVARIMAPDLIIGASSHSVEEVQEAQRMGASYVNIGPLFPTRTKEWDAEFLGVEGLKKISQVLTIPFTVMGGIKKEHIPALIEAGARTIALVTAVTQAASPQQAAAELLSLIRQSRSRLPGA